MNWKFTKRTRSGDEDNNSGQENDKSIEPFEEQCDDVQLVKQIQETQCQIQKDKPWKRKTKSCKLTRKRQQTQNPNENLTEKSTSETPQGSRQYFWLCPDQRRPQIETDSRNGERDTAQRSTPTKGKNSLKKIFEEVNTDLKIRKTSLKILSTLSINCDSRAVPSASGKKFNKKNIEETRDTCSQPAFW